MERYLVYGIAFGIADRVLQAAHLHLQEEQVSSSSIYWISGDPGGGLGSGASAMAIGDLASGFGSALSPPGWGSGGGVAGSRAVDAAAAVVAAVAPGDGHHRRVHPPSYRPSPT